MRSDASSRPSPGVHRLLILSTKCGAQSSPADDGAAEGDERVVDVVADLPADAQAAEPVQQRDRSFHDPAEHAQAGAVPGAAPGEVRGDLEPADLVPVDLVVIAAVGVQVLARAGAARPRPRSSPAAVASRSSPSRSPAPGAETPSGSRCTARTASRTAPCDYPDAYDLDAADYAGRPAAAARCAPTTRRRSPRSRNLLLLRAASTPAVDRDLHVWTACRRWWLAWDRAWWRRRQWGQSSRWAVPWTGRTTSAMNRRWISLQVRGISPGRVRRRGRR